MSEVVAHGAQVYLAVGRVRAGAVPEPMRGRFLEQIGSRAGAIVALPQAGRGAGEHVLDDGVKRCARQRGAGLGAFVKRCCADR